jgi:hypothetical protein
MDRDTSTLPATESKHYQMDESCQFLNIAGGITRCVPPEPEAAPRAVNGAVWISARRRSAEHLAASLKTPANPAAAFGATLVFVSYTDADAT